MVTVVALDLPSVLEGVSLLTISLTSSSSLRRCSSYLLIVSAWCRRCRSEDDDVSVPARTVEVRHAKSRRNDNAIRKRGAR